MIKLNDKTQNILAYGTDGEKALSDGFGRPLPFAVHLMCDLHMKDNISSKLTELGIPNAIAQKYKNDLFGMNIGNARQPGSIDALTSASEFDDKLDAIEEEWKTRHSQGQRFLEYFLKHKAGDIRSMVDLGSPPSVYVNAVLQREKQATGKKRLSLPQCVRLL